MGRVAVFIDGGYLDKVVERELKGARIDFLKFSQEVSGLDERLRSYYYHCPPYQSNPPTEDERVRKSRADAFYHHLTLLPRFEVRLVLAKHALGAPHSSLRVEGLAKRQPAAAGTKGPPPIAQVRRTI